jgi:hypothetical protein
MINPSTRLTITLEAQQWNTVLATLAEGPYRIVMPLMHEIQAQCNAQSQDQDQVPSSPGPNGISMKEGLSS